MIDRNGKPIGTDFSSFYAAGSLALEGRAGDVYDMAAHYAREQQIFGGRDALLWLAVSAALFARRGPAGAAALPIALIVWQGASLRFISPSSARSCGRCGAQTPWSRGSGCRWPPPSRRSSSISAMARTAFSLRHCSVRRCSRCRNGRYSPASCSACSPTSRNSALLIPVALLAAGTMARDPAAGVTVIGACGRCRAAFGADIWWAFAASTETSRKLLLEQGDVGFEKLQSVFAAMRMWGGSVPLAYAVQARASVAADRQRRMDWRTIGRSRAQGRGSVIATLLASPHVLDYDLDDPRSGDRILRRHGLAERFPRFRHHVLAAAWIVPLLARGIAGATGIPLGLMAMMTLFCVVMRRAMCDRAVHDRLAHGIAQA